MTDIHDMLGKTVRPMSPSGTPIGKPGKVIAVNNFPTYVIEHADGSRTHSSVHLVEEVAPWQDGDVITFRGHYILGIYVRANGKWTRLRIHNDDRSFQLLPSYSDGDMEHVLSSSDRYQVRLRGGRKVVDR